MNEKIYCEECEYFDDYYGEKQSCWNDKLRKKGKSPIYRNGGNAPLGNPFYLNRLNNCKEFKPKITENSEEIIVTDGENIETL